MSDATEPEDIAEFRAAGRAAIDWAARYLAAPEVTPVLSRSQPGELLARLPDQAPEKGEPLERILADFEALIVPGITHWNAPGFLAYFAITGSPPGIVAETLIATLNVNAMLWRTSPAATELEQKTLAWLAGALGLPEDWFGVINDTASMSTLLALAAARDRARPESRHDGLAAGGGALRVYTSEQAHSSVDKAAILLGLGHANVVKIATDTEFRMDPAALAAAVASDRRAGRSPLAIVATTGTTSTTSVDPVPAIADVAEREGLWLHVDAAYGGAAAIAPELRWVLAGVERADSVVVNPHKWLLTPVDLSVLWTRHPDVLRRAFSLVPDYLRTPETGVVNYMDYGVQLGHRFRALKLWFVMRAYGTAGLADVVRGHVRMAAALAARVDATPDLERLAPAPLSVVCFRHVPEALRARRDEPAVAAYLDRLNEAAVEAVNAAGRAFVSTTRLRGRLAMRVAIGNARTRDEHVQAAADALVAAARELHAAGAAGPIPA